MEEDGSDSKAVQAVLLVEHTFEIFTAAFLPKPSNHTLKYDMGLMVGYENTRTSNSTSLHFCIIRECPVHIEEWNDNNFYRFRFSKKCHNNIQ
ncbi:hypothetical protein NQ318_022953 [Aromia moschata]|uniref:Uncharacterized protein n=1 Tax=Aromia moschata TaxID=1265417 RepID=A0AAV8X982_9CUCU|nr:hypothetical protein NQ318_022953 [Aromia moschata]